MSPLRGSNLAAILCASLVLTGCTASPTAPVATAADPSGCAGIHLVVDFASLGPEPIDSCVDATDETSAADLLAAAGLTTEGTADYGDAIVCRVDGHPAADTPIALASGSYTEDCADMPSADAYWSVWVETDGVWDYAQVGFNDLELRSGDGLALSYTLNGNAQPPQGH